MSFKGSEDGDDIDTKSVETNSNMINRKRNLPKSFRYLKEASLFGEDLNSEKTGKKQKFRSRKTKNSEDFQGNSENNLNVHNIDKASRYVFQCRFYF